MLILSFVAYMWMLYYSHPYSVVLALAFGLVYLLLPLIIASLSTEFEPRRIILPPAYIELLTIGWFMVVIPLGRINWFITDPVMSILLVFVGGLCAAVLDQVTPLTLGYAVDPAKLQVHCFIAVADIKTVRERILTPRYQKTIAEVMLTIDIEQGAALIRTGHGYRNQLLILLREGKNQNETRISLAVFKKSQYEISTSDMTKELAREKILYLKAIMERPETSEKRIAVKDDDSPDCGEQLKSYILAEEAIGMLEKMSRISTKAWARIGLFAVSYLIPVWFYFFAHDITSALVTVAAVSATLAILSGVQFYEKRTS